jgi:hypothetical protein
MISQREQVDIGFALQSGLMSLNGLGVAFLSVFGCLLRTTTQAIEPLGISSRNREGILWRHKSPKMKI